jgi:hypothetical protein
MQVSMASRAVIDPHSQATPTPSVYARCAYERSGAEVVVEAAAPDHFNSAPVFQRPLGSKAVTRLGGNEQRHAAPAIRSR